MVGSLAPPASAAAASLQRWWCQMADLGDGLLAAPLPKPPVPIVSIYHIINVRVETRGQECPYRPCGGFISMEPILASGTAQETSNFLKRENGSRGFQNQPDDVRSARLEAADPAQRPDPARVFGRPACVPPARDLLDGTIPQLVVERRRRGWGRRGVARRTPADHRRERASTAATRTDPQILGRQGGSIRRLDMRRRRRQRWRE
mmetsp:Transcript_102819/g.294781  ORF Transcript_102819/g.294781 Transcript_102819/m.294781 type:complete len:205 (-) Transcript_102819:516-1130(-)